MHDTCNQQDGFGGLSENRWHIFPPNAEKPVGKWGLKPTDGCQLHSGNLT